MFHFKGGKGILSGGTIAIMIDWRIALVVWGGFLILAMLTRYVSLGSVWAGASFPFIILVLLPGSGHCGAGLYSSADWWCGSTGAISSGCCTGTRTEVQLPSVKTEGKS